MTDREFWLGIRRALLTQLDMIERRLGIEPTTAKLRESEQYKERSFE